MPQSKQPRTLNSLALKKCVDLVTDTCRRIEDTFGNYDEEICREQLNLLQEYLLTEVHSLLLQEIFDALPDFHIRLYQDARIVYALFMHKNLKRCGISLITRNDNFWISKLPNLNNLVHLNLKSNCTDAILQAVGENCLKLKYINIISRMEPEKLIIGNALKIKYFVSDQGLQYLAKCKDLREIEMNTIIRSNFGGKLTVAGIRVLLRSLLNLQHISYTYMGDVLMTGMDDVDKLALLSVADHNTQPHHMQAIARTCPDLKTLTLSATVTCNGTLNVLTMSDLKVKTLELQRYEFCVEMQNMFQVKGCFIVKLTLMDFKSMTVQDVELIGKTCPNVVVLNIMNVCQLHGNIVQRVAANRLFCHLESLQLSGHDWAIDAVYVCLSHALNIRNIFLDGGSHNLELKSMDTLFAHITLKNPMIKLQNICLRIDGPISMSTVEYFINNCSQLTSLSINYQPSIYKDFLKLQKNIQDRNMDLILLCEC